VPAVNYRLEGEVAVLTIANPPVNALSLAVREGLLQGLQRAEQDRAVRSVVVTGADGTFAAGADINEVASGLVLKSPITREVQAKMEAGTKPIVAAIEGVALGGGFELALACHWRVAAASARVGLPEVKLGLIPGAGGTQRFTRLAGPQAALEAITSGAHLSASRALELGLVDELAEPALAGALALARRAAAERRPLRIASDLTERIRDVSPELFAAFRRRLEPKARGQLAPWRIVDSIEAACTLPKEAAFAPYLPPSAEFPLGTDQLGRDILSRVIWGARLSLYVGLASVVFGVTLGWLWGVVSAYVGGVADTASQRVVDALMALPPIILALSLMAALGQSVNNVILALTILLTPTASRTLRALALSVRESPYVEAARAVGCPTWRVIVLHVLPNTFATYIVLVTVNVSYAIVVEASLSFLGLGAPPDEPSWGAMLTAGTQAMEPAPWMFLFPGLAISLTVFGLNLLGDAVRDLTDPHLRGGLG